MGMSTHTERLALYRAAEEAILDGQSFTHNGRQLTLPNLREVQSEIRRLERLVANENGAGGFKVATFASRDCTQ